jgi:hypothetical protein
MFPSRICLLALATSLAGPALAADTPAMSEPDARRFLGQASFGPTEASVSEARAKGRAAWLAGQFTLSNSDFTGHLQA